MTHESHVEHTRRAHLATACSKHHLTYGNRCLNCGFGGPAPVDRNSAGVAFNVANTITPDVAVARTILEQLGGNRFKAMVGANTFVSSPTSLSFRIGRNSSGIGGVRIVLDPSDTYTVEFIKISKGRPVVVSTASGVYYDNLRRVFESNTGMATHL